MDTAVPMTIYPTFVIGLGGTGTNVVRYVKRRFLRSWKASDLEDLPSVLQILAVDTEPLVNAPGEEPLYFHEFAFMGKYDATRLIQNRNKHQPYLDWWQWNDQDLPLGYIHNGARQLRPIGRLSFFRNYVTFKNLMNDKLTAMKELEAIQEAQERSFSVAADYTLIFIVSSLCGGTGAGMFLDVAHRIRHQVGSNASIMGIFMMPSVFEKEVRSDLQRRRIQANAYAALQELNYFHVNQNFRAFYPSEQKPLPEINYRAFNQIFLIERTSSTGRTLSSKANAEQMAAHLIHLTTFSHLNKRILGLDVNITEERKATLTGTQGTYLSYSSFGVSALVMPRETLWQYFVTMTTYWTVHTLLMGREVEQSDRLLGRIYLNLRDELKATFSRYADSYQQVRELREDIRHREGRWQGFVTLFHRNASHILREYGIQGLRTILHRFVLESDDADLRRDDFNHPIQRPFEEPQSVAAEGLRERLLSSPEERTRRVLARQARALFEQSQQTWDELVGSIRAFARVWEQQSDDLQQAMTDMLQQVVNDAEEIASQVHPLRRTNDSSTSTFYDLETGAVGQDHLAAYWDMTSDLLLEPLSEDDPRTRWDILLDTVVERLVPDGTNTFVSPGQAELRTRIEQAFRINPDLASIQQQAAANFDLRHIAYVQHQDGLRPANHRLDQMFQRLSPYASVDGDTYPYTEADQEHSRLVGTPIAPREKADGIGRVFHQALRSYSQFEWVKTGDSDRIDACHIVHGLPISQLRSMPDLYRQYHGPDFPRRVLHIEPEWERMPDIYTPPEESKKTVASNTVAPTTAQPDSSSVPSPRRGTI